MPGGGFGGGGIAAHRRPRRAGLVCDRHLHGAAQRGGPQHGFRPVSPRTAPGLTITGPIRSAACSSCGSPTATRSTSVSARAKSAPPAAQTQIDVPEESLMLTGDENIADVNSGHLADRSDQAGGLRVQRARSARDGESGSRKRRCARSSDARRSSASSPPNASSSSPRRRKRRSACSTSTRRASIILAGAIAVGRSARAGHRRVPRRDGRAAGHGARAQRGRDLRQPASFPKRAAPRPASCRRRKPIASRPSRKRAARPRASRRSTSNIARRRKSRASACILKPWSACWAA